MTSKINDSWMLLNLGHARPMVVGPHAVTKVPWHVLCRRTWTPGILRSRGHVPAHTLSVRRNLL